MQIIWRLELKDGNIVDVFSAWLNVEGKQETMKNGKQDVPVIIAAISFVPKIDDILPDGVVETVPAHFLLISGVKSPNGIMPYTGLDQIWADEVKRVRREFVPNQANFGFEEGPCTEVNDAYKEWWEETTDQTEKDEDDEDEKDPPPAPEAQPAASS